MALFHRIKSSFADNEPEAQGSRSFEVQSVGDLLRQQRLALDIEVSEAAAALKIKPAYLAAIEEGCLDQLPGATYAVGFIRSYSQYLGLESTELLRRFKLEAAGLQAKPDLTFPMPLREGSLPAGRVLTVAVILAVCGYGIWYHMTAPGRTVSERVAEVPTNLLPSKRALSSPSKALSLAAPARAPEPRSLSGAASELRANGVEVATTTAANRPDGTAARSDLSGPEPMATSRTSPLVKASPLMLAPIMAPLPTPAAARVASTASSAPVPAMALAPTTVPAGASSPELMPPASAARVPAEHAPSISSSPPALATTGASASTFRDGAPDTTGAHAALQPQREDGTHLYGAPEDSSRITVRANADSWIQIRGANHSILFTGVLKPGDTYRVPDHPGLTMRAGNAGGLEIIVDGKPAPPLGPMGAVRDLSLEPQTLAGQSATQD